MRTISLLTLAASLATPPSLAAQSPFRTNRNAPMPPWPSPLGDGIYDVCAGDVDGDGDVDLVIGMDHDRNLLMLNDGRGGFVDATAGRLVTPATPTPGSGYANATYEVDLADADGDGDLDLFVVNDHDVVDRLYLNNGLGFFTEVTATATPTYPDYGVDQVVADFDGDGDVDWLICNTDQLRLLLNNGAGVFTDAPAGSVPGGVFGDNRSFAADLDQDGDPDVVLGRGGFYASGNPRILVNQGNAVFTLAPAATIPFPGLVHAADVDGDGKLDLLANNGSQLLRNLGGLVFAPAVALPTSSLVSLDYDLDGDIDLLGNGKLLVNDGTGTFTLVTTGVTLNGDGACVADLDSDGDPDVVDTVRAACPRASPSSTRCTHRLRRCTARPGRSNSRPPCAPHPCSGCPGWRTARRPRPCRCLAWMAGFASIRSRPCPCGRSSRRRASTRSRGRSRTCPP